MRWGGGELYDRVPWKSNNVSSHSAFAWVSDAARIVERITCLPHGMFRYSEMADPLGLLWPSNLASPRDKLIWVWV
jgi:hypothetical protein